MARRTLSRILLIVLLLAGTYGIYTVRRRLVITHSAKASSPPTAKRRAASIPSSEQDEICQTAADRLKGHWPVFVNQLWEDPSGRQSAGFTYVGLDGRWHDCPLVEDQRP